MKNKKAQIGSDFFSGFALIIIILVIVAFVVGMVFFFIMIDQREKGVKELCEDNNLEYLYEIEGFMVGKYFCVGYEDGELVKYQVLEIGNKYKLYKEIQKK